MPTLVGRHRHLAVVTLALGAVLAACTSNPDPAPGAAPAGSADPPPAPVTLAFVGDIHAERGVARALRNDPASLLAGVRPALEEADLVVGNLETAVTEGGTPVGKAYTFRAPQSFLVALNDGGIDVLSLANNHGMDFGADGLADTLAARDATGVPVIGVGADEDEAFAPYSTTINGQRIAVIAASQVLDSSLARAWTAGPDTPGMASAYEQDRLLEEVRAARGEHDVVVVFLHWGTERQSCPNQRQRDLLPKLQEAGARIVVGSHAHVPLGGGFDQDTFVHYGLSNFLFYSGGRGNATVQTGVQLVTLTDGQVTDAQWRPARIGTDDLPVLLEGEQRDRALADWEQLRGCTGLQAEPS